MSPKPIHLPSLAQKLLETYFAGGLKENLLRPLAKEVEALSLFFTRGEGRSSSPPLYMEQKKSREAYILYYLPANLVKILYLLNKAFPTLKNSWMEKREFSFLDIGCGPGTAGLATLLFLHSLGLGKGTTGFRVHLYSADASPKVLSECRRLTRTLSGILQEDFPGWEVEHHTLPLFLPEGLEKFPAQGPFDAVFFSNLLAEIKGKKEEMHRGILRFVHKFLDPNGLAVFMEPAQRIYSRRLLGLRDAVAGESGLQILSPCPELLQCPALHLSEKDWCHDRLEWERPDFIAAMDKLAGIRKESLKFTHLLIKKGQRGKWATDQFVVVSELMEEKGKASVFLCGEKGRHEFELLEKDRSASNGIFFKLKRGKGIILHGYKEKKDKKRLGKESMLRYDPTS